MGLLGTRHQGGYDENTPDLLLLPGPELKLSVTSALLLAEYRFLKNDFSPYASANLGLSSIRINISGLSLGVENQLALGLELGGEYNFAKHWLARGGVSTQQIGVEAGFLALGANVGIAYSL